jgi:WD40 repeat protein
MLAAIFENTALVYRTTDWSLAAEIVSPERVYDVQFRSDVQTVVTAAGDGIVMEWPIPKAGEAAFGDAGRRVFQAESRIRAMAVTADESLIACGQDDGKISLLNSETGQVQFETVPLASTVRGLGFSNQQQELTVGYASGAVLSVNLSDQSVTTRLSLGQPIQKLIVSADGSKVAVTLDETSKLRAYTWPQARQLVEIEYRGSMSHMAFTQGGKQLIVSAGPYLDVFDASTGKRLGGDAELGTGYVHFQVFRDDSRMVVAEGSKGITIRELPSCRVLKRMLGSAAGIQRVAVSADGRNFASDGHEHLLRIWDAQTSETLLMLTGENGTGYAEELHFSRDGQKLFGFEGIILNVWESRRGELMPLSSAPAASARPTRP